MLQCMLTHWASGWFVIGERRKVSYGEHHEFREITASGLCTSAYQAVGLIEKPDTLYRYLHFHLLFPSIVSCDCMGFVLQAPQIDTHALASTLIGNSPGGHPKRLMASCQQAADKERHWPAAARL